MRKVTLTQDQVALVDDDLYEQIQAAGPWRLAYRKGTVHTLQVIRLDICTS